MLVRLRHKLIKLIAFNWNPLYNIDMFILDPQQLYKKTFGKCLICSVANQVVRFSEAQSALSFPTDFRDNFAFFNSFSSKEHLWFMGLSLLISATNCIGVPKIYF